MKRIATFDAGHGRLGTIQLTKNLVDCDVCNTPKLCILIDGSENEYEAGAICKECAVKAFEPVTTTEEG